MKIKLSFSTIFNSLVKTGLMLYKRFFACQTSKIESNPAKKFLYIGYTFRSFTPFNWKGSLISSISQLVGNSKILHKYFLLDPVLSEDYVNKTHFLHVK